MPRKPSRKNNEIGVSVGHYKVLTNYKNLKIRKDLISRKLENIINDNIWNLKGSFDILKDYYDELGQPSTIAWNEDIQYLDYVNFPEVKKISLEKFKAGEYKDMETNKKTNSKITEKLYASRIEFFRKTFPQFKRYEEIDDLEWVVKNNRELIYEIIKYNNDENNSLSTLSNDLKTLIRVIKLLLGETDELRYKISSLHSAISDIEKMGDDLNTIRTHHETVSFVPYEQLLTICDELEEQYNSVLSKLSDDIRSDGLKHGYKLFKLHQTLLAFAMNVWNYPSRSENYTLDIIETEAEAEANKNYIIISDTECKLIYNQEIKEHEPLHYIIKSSAIQGLNTRLCKLLNYSKKTYPRKHLFVRPDYWMLKNSNKIKHQTVSSWVRKIIPTKNIGIDTFRSAYVSYYYPKFNNQQKNVLKTRMRTSTQLILRSYLKVYDGPKTFAKVKIEPIDEETITHNITNVNTDTTANIIELRKETFRKWYDNEENKNKTLEKQRNPTTYARRYIRDLNSGRMAYSKLTQATIERYKIKLGDTGVYYIDE